MTDIQQARDVLKRWRDKALPGAWSDDHITALLSQRDGRLIVGTAGNPDLLDAIDALFGVWASAASWGAREFQVERIAAAIIAADERMTQ